MIKMVAIMVVLKKLRQKNWELEASLETKKKKRYRLSMPQRSHLVLLPIVVNFPHCSPKNH
jgi:hypothetical protein